MKKKTFKAAPVMVLVLVTVISLPLNVAQAHRAHTSGPEDTPPEDWPEGVPYYKPWLHGHNWIILNAIDLLRRDGFLKESEVATTFYDDLMRGSATADQGPGAFIQHYWDKGQWQIFDSSIDMRGFGSFPLIFDGKNAGGFNHFFDPWSHLGVGLSQDTEQVKFAIDVILTILAGILPLGFLVDILRETYADEWLDKWIDWDNWFGRNAGTAAVKAFDRAVKAWNAGYQEKAMFYLGIVLHLIGDVAGIPHHAANVLGSGHDDYEGWVDQEIYNTFQYYPDSQSALNAGTIYNINYESTRDHGIYQSDLFRLSDGIYLAGDPVQPGGGHIYQLKSGILQFIDFAAHESVEWYPLVNDGKGWGARLEDWWSALDYNYIFTHSSLSMRSSTDDLTSRLIFHFEGVDEVVAEFEGQWWGKLNDEAIDMENNFYSDLGYVKAYNGYSNDSEHLAERGGPYVCEGGLWWGPEPSATTPQDVPPQYKDATLQIETVVNRGREEWYADRDCDGWQLARVDFHDLYGPDDVIPDPLLDQMNRAEKYYTAQGDEKYLSSVLLDDPLLYPNIAKRISTVHSLDLAYKLGAGAIKLFMQQIGLPTVRPETQIVKLDGFTYTDPASGTLYLAPFSTFGSPYVDNVTIRAVMGRATWNNEYGRYDYYYEPGNLLGGIFYKKDWGENQDWQIAYNPDIQNRHIFDLDVPLPDDEGRYTISCYGAGSSGDPPQFVTEQDLTVLSFVIDKSPPETTIHVGEPSLYIPGHFEPGGYVPGEWLVTPNTPIMINASDGSGSGVDYIQYCLQTAEGQYVPGYDQLIWRTYTRPFCLGGTCSETIEVPTSTGLMMRTLYNIRPDFQPLQEGQYYIYAKGYDNLGLDADTGIHVTLANHIDGVDVKIDPHFQIIEPQSTATYNISVTNRYQTSKTYYLFLDGLDPDWFTLPETSIIVGPETTENITLTVSPPHTSLILKDYRFWLTASLSDRPGLPWETDPREADTEQATLKLAVAKPLKPAEIQGDVSITAPGVIPVAAGISVRTNLTVESSDVSHDNVIRLDITTGDIPVTERADPAWLSWTRQYIFMTLGLSIKPTINIPLEITIPPECQVGQKSFDVQANSLRGYPYARDEVRVCLSEDTEPPITSLNIDSPNYIDASGNTYVTSQTTLTLDATDGDQGVGIAATAYRIRNSAYDTGWTTTALLTPLPLTGLDDGTYDIDYNSTDRGGNLEPTKTTTVTLDNTGPTASILTPPIGGALTDGATFTISAIDAGSGVHSVNASVRMGNGVEAQPCGFEDLQASYDEATGKWTLFFNTLRLKDGYYTVLVETDDNLGNLGPPVFTPYSIRNWALSEELPSSAKNKAGRTMPIKFSIRVAAPVDPTQPFVYNEELTVKIYATTDPSNILQTSTYGDSAQDYRIDTISEKYVTNFKTLITPMQYTVSIYLDTFLIGSFTFRTEPLRAHYQDTSDNSRIDP